MMESKRTRRASSAWCQASYVLGAICVASALLAFVGLYDKANTPAAGTARRYDILLSSEAGVNRACKRENWYGITVLSLPGVCVWFVNVNSVPSTESDFMGVYVCVHGIADTVLDQGIGSLHDQDVAQGILGE
jgi:hypothetical protein